MKSLKVRRHFSAAHFYHQPAWSEEKNRAEFGKCFTEYGHGHDYTFEIEVTGDESLATGAICSVIDKIDHQHMNFVIPEFKTSDQTSTQTPRLTKIPTTENIALYLLKTISTELQNKKAEVQILNLRLFETPDIWIEVR